MLWWPPPSEEVGRRQPMHFVPLRTFDNYVEANIVMNMLVASDINAHLKDEYSVTIDPLLSPALGGIKLMVHYTQVERAWGLLEDAEAKYLETIPCPVCKAHSLKIISVNTQSSPMIAGYATRLLKDYNLLEGEELVKAFSYSMSSSNAPGMTAAWLEGFLKGTGTILLIDNNLWNVVNNWVGELEENVFTQVLPLLRRTFAHFSIPERKKIGEKVKTGGTSISILKTVDQNFDHERAARGIPIVLQLFGYKR